MSCSKENKNINHTFAEKSAATEYAGKGAIMYTDLYIERYDAFLAGVAYAKKQ